MSQNTEAVPFRTQLRVAVSNFLQKYRSLLLGLVIGAIVVIIALAIWTQVDAATKVTFASKIEKSVTDFGAWQKETDSVKKAELAKTLEDELVEIQKNAPNGYGLSKAWFLQGSYYSTEKKWAEAAPAFRMVFEKDHASYLAPIALVNAAVSYEEAGDTPAALETYAIFEKNFSLDTLLAPQVFFTQGRLYEASSKPAEALLAYKKLLEKFPESSWTKLGRNRIILLSQE